MNSTTFPTKLEIDPTVERDTLLLQRISRKDAAAFHEFHRLYAGLLFATVSQVLNDPRDSEDVLQDVLVMLWQKAHLYERSKGKPLTWLTTLARNRAIDRIRSRQRRTKLYNDFEGEHKVSQPEFADSAADSAEESERSVIVRKALGQLQPDQREAIHLAYFAGLSQADIARKLGKPLGTVKARIRRGVSQLEDIVKDLC